MHSYEGTLYPRCIVTVKHSFSASWTAEPFPKWRPYGQMIVSAHVV